MSFGFSIGDGIILTQLVTRAYNGWKNACGDYTNVTSSLAVLQTVLARVEEEGGQPDSIFTRNPDDLHGWHTVSKEYHNVVSKLEIIVEKYRSLGTSRKRNWDKIRMAHTDIADLDRESTKKTGASMQCTLNPVIGEFFPSIG
jgi:hypothetical protein